MDSIEKSAFALLAVFFIGWMVYSAYFTVDKGKSCSCDSCIITSTTRDVAPAGVVK